MKKFGAVPLVIVLVLCAGVGALTFFVMNKVKSGDFKSLPFLSLLNIGTKTDLGITYTEEDKKTVHDEIGSTAAAVTSESPECKSMTCVPGKAIYTGSQRTSVTMSNAQGTALINEWIQLSPNAPFSTAQMRVNSDGTVDFAGIVDMKRVEKFGVAGKVPAATMQLITKYVGSLGETFPLKASGKLTIKNNVVDANFSSIQVGIIPVPASILSQYKGEANSFVSDRLKVVQGLSIEELSFTDGKTTFKGSIPKSIYYVK